MFRRAKNSLRGRRGCRRIRAVLLILLLFGVSSFVTFPYEKNTRIRHKKDNDLLVAIVTTTRNVDNKRFEQWLRYHENVGFAMFYAFLDGENSMTPTTRAFSASQKKNVKLLSDFEGDMRRKRASLQCNKEEWLVPWIRKRGCNAELFVKQSQNVEMAIEMALNDNVDWIAHIDTDELLFPTGRANLDIRELLKEQTMDVDAVIFPNYEAVPETRGGVRDPFVDATVFKRNYAHMYDANTWKKFGSEAVRNKSLPNFFLAYANGKSIARIVPKLRSNGAHRFKFRTTQKSPSRRKFNEVTHPNAKILHYPYMNFNESKQRLRNCPCDAKSPLDTEIINQCFLLDFDRQAFGALVLNERHSGNEDDDEEEEEDVQRASRRQQTEEDWYNHRVVFDDADVTTRLVRAGVLERIHAPGLLVNALSS
tara:strand:- start:797 stop:2065 length:1269 start_codon:yes stop_codon:yes gene_type:complete